MSFAIAKQAPGMPNQARLPTGDQARQRDPVAGHCGADQKLVVDSLAFPIH
jgi:hypothetical protein